jgi:putative PIN family toxin of toxin-antitoxin system
MGETRQVISLRTVLDTNVVVSALLFSRGRLAWLRRAWQNGWLLPLISRDTASELIRVLAYPKFKLNAAERDELLAEYLPWCETVPAFSKTTGLPACRDPKDEQFLILARDGNADFLVTGDKDLLVVNALTSVEIVTPEQLRNRIEIDF